MTRHLNETFYCSFFPSTCRCLHQKLITFPPECALISYLNFVGAVRLILLKFAYEIRCSTLRTQITKLLYVDIQFNETPRQENVEARLCLSCKSLVFGSRHISTLNKSDFVFFLFSIKSCLTENCLKVHPHDENGCKSVTI